MRVLVDGRFIQDRYHGIGRYTFELLRAMPEQDGVQWVVLLHAKGGGRLETATLSRRADMVLAPTPGSLIGLRAQQQWPRHIRAWHPDVIFVPYHLGVPWRRDGTPVVTVIHDCIFERNADFASSRAMRAQYLAASRLALCSSQAIIAVSRATADDLRRYYGRHACAVVPHAVGDQFATTFVDGQAHLEARPFSVLHVGVRRPHKNHRTLLTAFAELVKRVPEATLTLIGGGDPRFPDDSDRLIADLGLRGRVVDLGETTDEQLLDAYRSSAAFAFPSIVEGFGLPILEAMAAGVPVVASDAEAIEETCGGGAVIVPAMDPMAWADALERVLTDDVLRASLRSRGRRVAEAARWDTSARATLDVLHEQASGHHEGGSG